MLHTIRFLRFKNILEDNEPENCLKIWKFDSKLITQIDKDKNCTIEITDEFELSLMADVTLFS